VRPDLAADADGRTSVDEVAALLDVQLDVRRHVGEQARRPALGHVAEGHAVAVAQLARLLPGRRPGREPRAQAGDAEA
jgi:hypothetical protein